MLLTYQVLNANPRKLTMVRVTFVEPALQTWAVKMTLGIATHQTKLTPFLWCQ